MDAIPNDLKHDLLNYFNGNLRRNLGFREHYFFTRFENGTIFFNISPGDSGDLYNILVSNPEITVRLKQELTMFLSSYFSDLINVGLSFNNNIFEIILERNPFQMINVNPYVTIASNLDTVEQINNFCRSSKGALDACKTTAFWRSLLKSIYPKPYKGEYKYEAAYKGYLQLKPYLFRDVLVPITTLNSEYASEYLRFLYNEEFIPLEDYKKFAMLAVKFGLDSVFQKIYTNISEKDRESMIKSLEANVQMSIAMEDVSYITNFFRMVPAASINNVQLLERIDIGSRSKHLDVNLVEPIVQYFMSDDRAVLCGPHLRDIILRNAIKNNDITLLDYAFKHLRYTRLAIQLALQILHRNGINPTPEVIEYLNKTRYVTI